MTCSILIIYNYHCETIVYTLLTFTSQLIMNIKVVEIFFSTNIHEVNSNNLILWNVDVNEDNVSINADNEGEEGLSIIDGIRLYFKHHFGYVIMNYLWYFQLPCTHSFLSYSTRLIINITTSCIYIGIVIYNYFVESLFYHFFFFFFLIKFTIITESYHYYSFQTNLTLNMHMLLIIIYFAYFNHYNKRYLFMSGEDEVLFRAYYYKILIRHLRITFIILTLLFFLTTFVFMYPFANDKQVPFFSFLILLLSSFSFLFH